MLRERVAQELRGVTLLEPEPASDGILALAHHPQYIARLVSGELSKKEMQLIGFPWSEQMVSRSRRSTGATIGACRAALSDGAAVNLAGGTHHAYADRGEGFCCFNDAVVAARLMQAERRVKRVAIIDLDVHQGNGTASITQNDDSIFTLSIHAASNYPLQKERSDLDVELADGTGDAAYLQALSDALNQMQSRFQPDLVIYLAGADPYEDDRLGRLKLSIAGLSARDRQVFDAAKRWGAPLALAMAGGYGRQISDTVAIHFESVSQALGYARGWVSRA